MSKDSGTEWVKEIKTFLFQRDILMRIFERIYDGENIIDFEQDIWECLQDSPVPTDECGFQKGIFRIIIDWEEDERQGQNKDFKGTETSRLEIEKKNETLDVVTSDR